MHHIQNRVSRLEADLNSHKAPYIGGIWLVGVSPDGSEHFVGGFLPIGRTETERAKNRAAAYERAGLEDTGLYGIPNDN